jgi:four helix bundle protein
MSFEKLRVYQAAERLDQLVLERIAKISRGHAKDVDQLKRASGSVLNNIAEAYGSESPGRKAAFLENSRGSSDEVRSALRRLARTGALHVRDTYAPAQLTVVIAKMLTSWIQRLDGGTPDNEP